MRVHLERRFADQDYNVYFLLDSGRQRMICRWRDGAWALEERDEAVRDLEPSLTLPQDALEGLVRAAEGHVHAQDATVRHLDDATATRDRLLALVEKRGLR